MKRKNEMEFEDSEITVPSPRWVQRRMYRNLLRVAHSNINSQLTKRASELLAAIDAESKPAAEPVSTNHSTAKAPIPPVASAATPVTRASRIRQWATVTLRKCACRVSAFAKRSFFRPAHSG